LDLNGSVNTNGRSDHVPSVPNDTAGPSAMKPSGTISSAQVIDTSPAGAVVLASASIAAPLRSLPAPVVTSTLPPTASAPFVPSPQTMLVEPPSSPHPAASMAAQTTHRRIPGMWARAYT
jgi:hypothetical protein